MNDGFGPFAEQEWPLEPCAGDTHTDAQGRQWTCMAIVQGARGGRWAYQMPANSVHVSNQHEFGITVVVDTIQNIHTYRFQGMLALPWDGVSKLGWVLAKEHCPPVHEKLVAAPKEAVRFERLEEPPKEDE